MKLLPAFPQQIHDKLMIQNNAALAAGSFVAEFSATGQAGDEVIDEGRD